MSIGTAMFATLFANFLFAFWYQSIKHLGDYPLAGFVLWLYLASAATVGAVAFLRLPVDLPYGLAMELRGRGGLAVGVLLGGFIMTAGLVLTLTHMRQNGIVSNQAIAGTANSILGLGISFWLGGLPQTVSWRLVTAGAGVLLAASAVCQYSLALNSSDEEPRVQGERGQSGHRQSLLHQNLVVIASMALMNGYIISFTLGTRSASRPEGFHPLVCVMLLCMGSLLCAICYAMVSLTRAHRWQEALHPQKKLPIALAAGSGVCHYGGNLLLLYALPVVSAPVSFLLSKTSNLWGCLWGLLYGEYKNAGARAKAWLTFGILLYLAGTLTLAYALYA